MISCSGERSAHRWRPLADAGIVELRGGVAFRSSAPFGTLSLPLDWSGEEMTVHKLSGLGITMKVVIKAPLRTTECE
jgi:hypothetical protein